MNNYKRGGFEIYGNRHNQVEELQAILASRRGKKLGSAKRTGSSLTS